MFTPSIWNAWPLSAGFVFLSGILMITRRDIARRMSDMTGYTIKEKLLTILASLAPYPFMLLTIWTPFTTTLPLLLCGMLIYLLGMFCFIASLQVILTTPPGELFLTGPYRLTRNPVYVSATLVFLGIGLATASWPLLLYLAAATLLQHQMIVAEERICLKKYGRGYEVYMKSAPRYF